MSLGDAIRTMIDERLYRWKVASLIDTLNSNASNGWTPITDSWTYASATTITVPSDATLRYSKGDKIKLTQSATIAYFYIIAVSSTTLTITGGDDYTLTNNPISAIYVSKQVSPVGFPQVFHYAPTVTGFSVNPSKLLGRFSLIGTKCFFNYLIPSPNAGTSNSTGFTLSIPIVAGDFGDVPYQDIGQGIDNGAYQGAVFGQVSSLGTSILLGPQGGAVAWTASGNKAATGKITYDI